ncbi:hypothetical protein ACGF12_21325 [Kitasatospora sp. NPDC048296]|uniref:hypothetical protein n=1 Tax=Kitasatospora sp. NPDC048296 TaxID=3364048 RepID=UPI0037149677
MDGAILNPVTNSQIDPVFANSQFGHPVSTVVREGDPEAGTAKATAMQTVLGPNGRVCNDPVAAADPANYRYPAVLNCGFMSHP